MFIINKRQKDYDENTKIADVFGFTCKSGFGFTDIENKYLVMFWEDYNVPDIYNIETLDTLKECVEKNNICHFENIDFIAFNNQDFKLIFQKNT